MVDGKWRHYALSLKLSMTIGLLFELDYVIIAKAIAITPHISTKLLNSYLRVEKL